MKAVIVDDDKRIIHLIRQLISESFSDVEVVATAGTINEGISRIRELQPYILFLDINLPDGTGFDLLKIIGNINFKLIFITGHEEYAIKAFKYSAIDYILKPININDLSFAIDKARNSVLKEEETLKVKTLLENMDNQKNLKRIILRTSEYIHIVEIEDIVRCEADNNYTFFYLNDDSKILVSKTIKEYSAILSSSCFIRVHQSHLVNAKYIDKYVKSDGGYLLLKNKECIPISQHSKHDILKKLETLMYQ